MSSGFLNSNLDARHHRVDPGAPLKRATNELFVGLLHDIHARLSDPESDERTANQALDELFLALRDRKLHSDPREWREFVEICRQHPLMSIVHQDPFTYRAFSKPRGYAGDAIMMDYIYGREEDWDPPPAPPVGQRVFNYTTKAPASEGVRSRRAFIARQIDRLAESRRLPHVLSIASGHLREVGLSAAARRCRLGRYVALDADAESLSEVTRCYGRYGVETLPTPFRSLLGNRFWVGKFDLVYSNGLFDYLENRVAARLVSAMFGMLRRGGSLVVANFLPGVRDVGYMEAYMDWTLIYRTRTDMVALTAEIPESEVRQVRLFTEENQNIIFLHVIRNSSSR